MYPERTVEYSSSNRTTAASMCVPTALVMPALPDTLRLPTAADEVSVTTPDWT